MSTVTLKRYMRKVPQTKEQKERLQALKRISAQLEKLLAQVQAMVEDAKMTTAEFADQFDLTTKMQITKRLDTGEILSSRPMSKKQWEQHAQTRFI